MWDGSGDGDETHGWYDLERELKRFRNGFDVEAKKLVVVTG